MNLLLLTYNEFISAIARALTGRLFTEQQIRNITTSAVGKYFTDFFPTPKEEIEAQQRVERAGEHIAAAASIIRDMEHDLEKQGAALDGLLHEIEDKRRLADHYQALAITNESAFVAFRLEMETALRRELTEQAHKGRRLRQIMAFLIWLLTLALGAAIPLIAERLLAT